MTERSILYKMFVLSLLLHIIFLVVLSTPIKKRGKKIDIPFAYSVNLVSSIEHGSMPQGKAEKEIKSTLPAEKENRQVRTQRVAKREVLKKVIEEKSISKKKIDYRSTTKEELTSLEQKIRELKTRTRYLNVGQKGPTPTGTSDERISGLPIGAVGGSSSLNLTTQAYIADVWSKVKKAWAVPGGFVTRKDVETIVIVKIRKDGRIVDIEVEKRSGNRIYDESVLRTLRSVDPFPPFPETISTEYLEIGFRFLPGELS